MAVDPKAYSTYQEYAAAFAADPNRNDDEYLSPYMWTLATQGAGPAQDVYESGGMVYPDSPGDPYPDRIDTTPPPPTTPNVGGPGPRPGPRQGPGPGPTEPSDGGGPGPGPSNYRDSGLTPFDYPEFAPPPLDMPSFAAPAAFSYPDFVAPSGQEVLNEDPGYQFRIDESNRALGNSASARGMLRSGQFADAMAARTQGLASQEYDAAFGRRFNTWGANRQAKAEDYDRLWRNTLTDYMVDYNAEADEYNRALSTYGTNFGTAAARQGFDIDAANIGLQNRQFGLSQQNSEFNKLLSLYDLSTRNLPQYSPPSFSAYGF